MCHLFAIIYSDTRYSDFGNTSLINKRADENTKTPIEGTTKLPSKGAIKSPGNKGTTNSRINDATESEIEVSTKDPGPRDPEVKDNATYIKTPVTPACVYDQKAATCFATCTDNRDFLTCVLTGERPYNYANCSIQYTPKPFKGLNKIYPILCEDKCQADPEHEICSRKCIKKEKEMEGSCGKTCAPGSRYSSACIACKLNIAERESSTCTHSKCDSLQTIQKLECIQRCEVFTYKEVCQEFCPRRKFVDDCVQKCSQAFLSKPKDKKGNETEESEKGKDTELQYVNCLVQCHHAFKLNPDMGCIAEPYPRTVHLTDFSTCRWIVDFSMTDDPTKVWSTYFNEKPHLDVKHSLERPNTKQFLEPSDIGGYARFFVFPYFLIVRVSKLN